MHYLIKKVLILIYVTVVTCSYKEKAKSPVQLNKLCSWNVLSWNDPHLLKDSWSKLMSFKSLLKSTRLINHVKLFIDECRMDVGRSYIQENNIPWSFAVHSDGRVFVGVRRDRLGVYSSLNYFNISDIKDGECPPLNPYPSLEMNDLSSACCGHPDRITNVDRFNIDTCRNNPKLWVVDIKGINTHDANWAHEDPVLNVFRLSDNKLLRRRPIPGKIWDNYQFGLTTVVVNVNPENCDEAYAYIIDTHNGIIAVYSWNDDRFWRFKSPYFYCDAKYGQLCVKTSKGSHVTYFRDNQIYDATVDIQNQQLLFHSIASLDVFAIDLHVLNNQTKAACSPDGLDIKYLGRRNDLGQTGTEVINKNTQTVWGIQEQTYAITCWNRENPLNPNAIKLVIQDAAQLPYPVDLKRANGNVYVLSNNYYGVTIDGLNANETNFGIFYINETEALRAFPGCATYKLPSVYPSPTYNIPRSSYYPPHYSQHRIPPYANLYNPGYPNIAPYSQANQTRRKKNAKIEIKQVEKTSK